MRHYTCTGGCGGESDQPAVCQAEDCLKHGKDMTECDCHDGEHGVDDEFDDARH